MSPTRCCILKGMWEHLPPFNECPPHTFDPTSPHLSSSWSLEALDRACCLGKMCQWAMSSLAPGAHLCLLVDITHRKTSKHIDSSCNECLPHTLDTTLPHLSSPRSHRASMLPRKRVDASSSCLYQSYEGFTHCSYQQYTYL